MKASSLLVIEASPYGWDASGVALIREALDVQLQWSSGSICWRDLSDPPLPLLSADYARAVTEGAPREAPAFRLSEQLIQEVEAARAVLISTPLHNGQVPAVLKQWLDYVVRKGRSFTVEQQHKVSLLISRPAWILVRSGRPCQGHMAHQIDHLTPYLQALLPIIGLSPIQWAYWGGSRNDQRERCRHQLMTFLNNLDSVPG